MGPLMQRQKSSLGFTLLLRLCGSIALAAFYAVDLEFLLHVCELFWNLNSRDY